MNAAAGLSSSWQLDALEMESRLDGIRNILRTELQTGGWKNEGAFHQAKGFFSLYEGDLENAVREWEQALSLDPANASLRGTLEKGRSQLKEQKTRERVQDLVARGKDYYEVGGYAKARAKFQEVLGLDASNEEARRYVRMIEERLDDQKKQETVEAKLSDADAFLRKGELLEAIPSLVDALSLDPRNERARYHLAAIKKRLSIRTAMSEAPAKAAEPGKKGKPEPSAEESPDVVKVYALGMAYYAEDDLDNAMACFKKSMGMDPSFARAAKAYEAAAREKSFGK